MKRKMLSSRTLQALARTKLCMSFVQSGMPLKEALNEAHILRPTYDKYLPVIKKMTPQQLIELPVPAKRKKQGSL